MSVVFLYTSFDGEFDAVVQFVEYVDEYIDVALSWPKQYSVVNISSICSFDQYRFFVAVHSWDMYSKEFDCFEISDGETCVRSCEKETGHRTH